MDERFATPALEKIAQDGRHPARELALELLLQQATRQALDVLRKLDLAGFPSDARKAVQDALRGPRPFQPRLQPKTTRTEFIAAFEALTNNNFDLFMDLVEKVPDGEKDVVAVMKSDDLPLIRKVRRAIAATGHPHQMAMYPDFTRIIYTLLAQ